MLKCFLKLFSMEVFWCISLISSAFKLKCQVFPPCFVESLLLYVYFSVINKRKQLLLMLCPTIRGRICVARPCCGPDRVPWLSDHFNAKRTTIVSEASCRRSLHAACSSMTARSVRPWVWSWEFNVACEVLTISCSYILRSMHGCVVYRPLMVSLSNYRMAVLFQVNAWPPFLRLKISMR
jgi:hypothetical protein